MSIYDLVVIGGGVNGCGIANDAAGRGLNVLLCEKNDLASSTSSNSTKLIHGGLRYLEHYEFRLVKEALAERETLLNNAPHIMWPLRFILPHRPHLRPRWMILAGLFLYDHLSKRNKLKRSCGVSFKSGSPLVDTIKNGYEYSDGWVDDARLVVLNAMSAKRRGATVCTRTACVSAVREKDCWSVELQDTRTQKVSKVKCRMLVNAGGPWVADLFKTAIQAKAPQNVRLVKGSHIVVPKIHDQEQAYILQNEDNRIVFVIPYEDDFSLVGTTDVEVKQDPSQVKISDDEINYLIEVSNSHFKKKISRDDIVHTYSGVRPLLDDESSSPQAITRDYTLELDKPAHSAPLLSVFGGKITTYRKLAAAAVDRVVEFFPSATESWTKTAALPGGDFTDPQDLELTLSKKYPWLEKSLLTRYIRTYGTLVDTMLASCRSLSDMGEHFGGGLYRCEVDYLVQHEWALTAEDILWRRTKLGLRLNPSQQDDLASVVSEMISADGIENYRRANTY